MNKTTKRHIAEFMEDMEIATMQDIIDQLRKDDRAFETYPDHPDDRSNVGELTYDYGTTVMAAMNELLTKGIIRVHDYSLNSKEITFTTLA